jgi:Family of unknown function (DUF6352)
LSERKDFWLASGHHLLDRDSAGRLLVTDEFLKAYLARPELVPPQDACAAERQLHDVLLGNPRQAVSAAQIAAIEDADARENWEVMIGWRDHLAGADTLEAAYLEIFRRSIKLPHIFIDQLVQAILRNLLDDCDDAFVLRAAELFFRPQKLTLRDGRVLAADQETAAGYPDVHASPLTALLGLPSLPNVDVLDEVNAGSYWARSDMFDMALDLTAGQHGLTALGDVIARWIGHLLAIDVRVEPLTELRDVSLTWYVGLDSEATRIGDAFWRGEDVGEARRSQVIGFYRLTFVRPGDANEGMRGEPVYLVLAMTPDGVLRLKPQNVVMGLPVSRGEMVH